MTEDDGEPAEVVRDGAAPLLGDMARLAAGLVPPDGKPMSSLELSELRSLMATGTYVPKPAPGAAPVASAGQASPSPLSAAEIATVRTMMAIRPSHGRPMPSAAVQTDTIQPDAGPSDAGEQSSAKSADTKPGSD